MTAHEPPQSATPPLSENLPLSPRGIFFRQHAWLPFVAPLVVYMLSSSLFDTTLPGDHLSPEHSASAQERYATQYLWMVTFKAALLLPIAAFVYWSLHLPRFRISPLAITVGVVGVVLWVGIDAIGIKTALVDLFGEESWAVSILGLGARDALNPIDQYGAGTATFWWFMVARFVGLALCVPIVEELMLRGWMVRVVDNPAFWQIPFGEVTFKAAAAGVAFATLYHPEKLAAIVWFSLTMWLMLKTKNFWDCVAAHAVTNFLLGVWVVWRGAWELW